MKLNGKFINGDCMDYLPQFEDNYFDLAIVDPPYGIDITNHKLNGSAKNIIQSSKRWDIETPSNNYFIELQRVSKNQIIWGGNYFNLPPTKSIIIWDKENGDSFMYDGELAWCSDQKIGFRIYREFWISNMIKPKNMPRIHPTQKSIDLYRWLLKNYAKEGDLILDTHVGSASSLIACEDMGFKYVGYELDKDYYDAATKRLKNHIAQLKLF